MSKIDNNIKSSTYITKLLEINLGFWQTLAGILGTLSLTFIGLYIITQDTKKASDYTAFNHAIHDKNIFEYYEFPGTYTSDPVIEKWGYRQRIKMYVKDIETDSVLMIMRYESVGTLVLRIFEVFDGPNFDFDKFELGRESFQYYRQLGKIFLFTDISFKKVRDFSSIVILGFSDPAGPESYNLGLSERRAQYVKEQILIDIYPMIKEKIKVIGKGEELIEYEYNDFPLQKEISDALGIDYEIIKPLDVREILENIGDNKIVADFRGMSIAERDSVYNSDKEKYKKAFRKFRVVYLIGVIGPYNSPWVFVRRYPPQIIIAFSIFLLLIIIGIIAVRKRDFKKKKQILEVE